MPVPQSGISEPPPQLDYPIEYTKGAIAKKAASVERLADQGRDFTAAAKHLTIYALAVGGLVVTVVWITLLLYGTWRVINWIAA